MPATARETATSQVGADDADHHVEDGFIDANKGISERIDDAIDHSITGENGSTLFSDAADISIDAARPTRSRAKMTTQRKRNSWH